MSKKSKKVNDWNQIAPETQTELLTLRATEKEFLDKSGYNEWKRYFLSGYLAYSLVFYGFVVRKSGINNKNLFLFLFPAIPYGYILHQLFFDKNAYKQYYLTHLELNRLIKKTSKSSEYK